MGSILWLDGAVFAGHCGNAGQEAVLLARWGYEGMVDTPSSAFSSMER